MPRLCLSKFKLCIRSTKDTKSADYESVPYEPAQSIEKNPTAPLTQQIILNLSKINKLNSLKKNTAKRNLRLVDGFENQSPNFHSTHIDQSSMNYTTGFKEIESSKITSTALMHNEISCDSFESPELSDITEESSAFSNPEYNSPTKTSIFTDDYSTTFGSTKYFSGCESEEFQSVNSSFFDNEQVSVLLHVCCRPYRAEFDGDIDLQYTERVQIMKVNGDFSLVKKITTQETGYVSTECLVLWSDFIKNC